MADKTTVQTIINLSEWEGGGYFAFYVWRKKRIFHETKVLKIWPISLILWSIMQDT